MIVTRDHSPVDAMRIGLSVCISILTLAVVGGSCEGVSNKPADSNNLSTPQQQPEGGPKTSVAETVKIESPDKVMLIGTFYRPAMQSSPALLLLHQWQSDRHAYDDLAKRLQAKGFGVLSIDGRGFGESTKTTDGKTVSAGRTANDVKAMLGDVDAAFGFLSKQQNVDAGRIGIVGASYGSSLALLYAAENIKVASVALLSPGLNYFGNMPTEPAITKYGDRPLYLLAALDDKESAAAVEKLNPILGNKVKYEQTIHPSGGHGTALLKVGAAEELEDFFTRHLGLVK